MTLNITTLIMPKAFNLTMPSSSYVVIPNVVKPSVVMPNVMAPFKVQKMLNASLTKSCINQQTRPEPDAIKLYGLFTLVSGKLARFSLINIVSEQGRSHSWPYPQD
jgi:hypothetical protein